MAADPVLVVGGGFAGLSAAVRLASAGVAVTLLDKRAQLGGRAYSLVDEESGDEVDNGQHLFMGCYHATRRLLQRIGSADGLRLQERLRLAFVEPDAGGRPWHLASAPLPGRLHLAGLAAFSGLGAGDKLRLMAWAARGAPLPAELDTVDVWLDRLGQSAHARRRFWHPLALATLNTDAREAAARPLYAVVRAAFFGSGDDASLGLARVGLSRLYVDPALAWLGARGVSVRAGAAVAELLHAGTRVRGVRLRDGSELPARHVIAAVPPAALLGLWPPGVGRGEAWVADLGRLPDSPIVSLGLWLDRLVTDEEIIGVIGRPLHWIFNRNRLASVRAPDRSHLSLVVSAAQALVDRPSDSVIAALTDELRRALPAARPARVVRARLFKERAATIAHTVDAEQRRPRATSPLDGLFAAGDWVQTGLPATIESAVRSGELAAERVLDDIAATPLSEIAASAVPARGDFVPIGRLVR